MTTAGKPLKVLFLCTGNSARSQIAEALLNLKGKGRFISASAGSHPAERVNPFAVKVLAEAGIDWTGRIPRRVDELTEKDWDVVITVCDRAKESCPIFPGNPIFAHWGMPDPAEVQGSDEEKRRAFRETFIVLGERLDRFLALPMDGLDRVTLERRVREIGGHGQ